MSNRFEGLKSGCMPEFEKLAEIFEHQVFELCKSAEGEGEYLIPYMMNDAVEDYLILKNCRVVGDYLKGKEEETTARLSQEKEGYVLIVRQGEDNVVTLHFAGMEESIKCYQYHRIGHFWVKGQEHWRRLVYMIGTIYDKCEFLGEEFCNQSELDILRLVEFAPFREWSPVHESLEERYPSTYDGIDVMEHLAQEAGDTSFEKMIRLYRRFPSRRLEKILSKRLLSPKREKLYHLICEKVNRASEEYPKRDYGDALNEIIEKKRNEVHRELTAKGFQGIYPEYYRAEQQVLVTEEHPFTMMEMEYENFGFRVQFMVSECGKRQRGWITSEIGDL